MSSPAGCGHVGVGGGSKLTRRRYGGGHGAASAERMGQGVRRPSGRVEAGIEATEGGRDVHLLRLALVRVFCLLRRRVRAHIDSQPMSLSTYAHDRLQAVGHSALVVTSKKLPSSIVRSAVVISDSDGAQRRKQGVGGHGRAACMDACCSDSSDPLVLEASGMEARETAMVRVWRQPWPRSERREGRWRACTGARSAQFTWIGSRSHQWTERR